MALIAHPMAHLSRAILDQFITPGARYLQRELGRCPAPFPHRGPYAGPVLERMHLIRIHGYNATPKG